MLVNKDNTVGLIVKNNFAPKSDLLAKQPFDFAERTSLQSTWDALKLSFNLPAHHTAVT